MHDGSSVIYVGPTREDLAYGTSGRVLTCTASYAHVQWSDGARQGQVDLHATEDLSFDDRHVITASLDDSLEVGSLVSLASAEEAYTETGGDGLVTHLASAGHLTRYASLAEEALERLTAALGSDPVLRQLTSAMDPVEAETVLRRAAQQLFTDSGDF